MIRALLIVLLVVLLGGFVKAPAGWHEDVEQANALAKKADGTTQFGGARAVATAQVFVAADGPATLYLTAIAGKVKDHRDDAARVAVDDFLGAARRAQLSSAKVSVAQSASRIDAAARLIEATLQWQDNDAQTTTHARLLIAGDDENLVAVTGECVVSTATPPAARDACVKALATLDPGIAPDKRVVLALAPEGSEPPPSDAPTMGSGSRRPQATMSDSSGTPMPPIKLPEAKRTVDRRPMYVGLVIFVLAGLFWWNRRRREKFETDKENDE